MPINTRQVAVLCGTRPEIIKLAPVVNALRHSAAFSPYVISSGQHREMASQAFEDFGLTPDSDLALMTGGQTPNSFLAKLLAELEKILSSKRPDLLLIQGDTTTVLGGAITAFHLGIPIGHVEAGLRTGSKQSPFPEEMNRTLVSQLASFHFCPTERAIDNLKREGITEHCYMSGNTVVDALASMSARIKENTVKIQRDLLPEAIEKKRFVLITGHRRENFEQPLANLCAALIRLADTFPDHRFVYPVHLNPKVAEPVRAHLGTHPSIDLLSPLDYPSMIYLMERAELIITDSGGIQEEAPTFGTPLLVTRSSTERPEVIDSGFAQLTPLDSSELLFDAASAFLERETPVRITGKNPFGDGKSAERIVAWLEASLTR